MEPYDTPNEADLLAHESFLEELSHNLVHDHQTADDLVQDTWLTALERPPRHQSNLGAWLRAVARNLAIRRIRTTKRRVRRETEVARPESSSPRVFDDREETLVAVTGAVHDLGEPYRTVIILRFFEDLPRARSRRVSIAPSRRSRVNSIAASRNFARPSAPSSVTTSKPGAAHSSRSSRFRTRPSPSRLRAARAGRPCEPGRRAR